MMLLCLIAFFLIITIIVTAHLKGKKGIADHSIRLLNDNTNPNFKKVRFQDLEEQRSSF